MPCVKAVLNSSQTHHQSFSGIRNTMVDGLYSCSVFQTSGHKHFHNYCLTYAHLYTMQSHRQGNSQVIWSSNGAGVVQQVQLDTQLRGLGSTQHPAGWQTTRPPSCRPLIMGDTKPGTHNLNEAF